VVPAVAATLYIRHAGIHWVYYFPLSFTVCFIIAWLVSLFQKPPRP